MTMKRIFVILIAVLLVFSFAACGNKDAGDDPNLGMWKAVTVQDGDYTYDAADAGFGGFDIELKSGGKLTVYMDGDKNNGTWKLDGAAFTMSAGLMDVTGTLENGKLTLIDMYSLGLTIIFYKDGVKPAGSSDGGASSGGSGGNLDGALAWWDGEFYGYWVAEKASGDLKNLEGGVWDCYAVIDVDSDGTATMYIWDDEIDIATAKIKIDPEGGVAPMGSAKSIGGEAFDEPLGDADWIIVPTYDGYEDYYGNIKFDDFMEIEGVADENDYLRYTIVLRPWGLLWDDVPADQRPPFYEEWYKGGGLYNEPLLDILNDALFNGKSAHIHSALAGGAPSGGGASASSGGSADFPILSLTNAQLKEKWNDFRDSHDLWSDIRYDELVKLLGVEGGVLEDEDTYIEYRWYASDDGSLTVSFSKPSGEFSSSSMNQYGRPD